MMAAVTAAVAPYVGAWIETATAAALPMAVCPSLPTWERGLKLVRSHTALQHRQVAPYVGAWIETLPASSRLPGGTSLPTWERGLKLDASLPAEGDEVSLPTWERGLKPHHRGTTGLRCRRSLRGSVD